MSEPQNHEHDDVLDLAQFTRRLNSGLIVPEAPEETTAPIDIVDRRPEELSAPVPRPRPPAPAASLPRPASPPNEAAVKSAPVRAKDPSRKEHKAARRAAHADAAASRRTVREALVDFLDRRHTARADEFDDEPITVGAFVGVGVLTLVVAALSFALSFDMMYAAAQNYGWGKTLAALFPVIIDVGAIGGTFMGAISANKTYRQIGHQVLVVTLAASVLFNLVGHDIKGTAAALFGAKLPDDLKWTGVVAAILVPMLLAYFVHAFSKALKTFTDQKRAAKAAAEAEAAAERQRRAEAAEKARIERQREAAAAEERRRQAELAEQRRIERETRQAQRGQLPSAPAKQLGAAPVVRAKAERRRATVEDAVAIGLDRGVNTPKPLKEALAEAGFVLPSSATTIENWCARIKAKQEEQTKAAS